MTATDNQLPKAASLPRETVFNRRDVLRVGSLTVAANVLPPGLTSQAARWGHLQQESQAQSVIFLWMGGGVTHLDSFDPKPDAPQEIRGELTDIATNVPGIRFCETLPHLAAIADELAVIRTFSHDSNDHFLSQAYTLSGRKVTTDALFDEPNIGSTVSYLLGPRNGLPGYIAVPGFTRPGPPPTNLFVGGWLGKQHAPFCAGRMPANLDFTTGNVADNPSPFAEEVLRPAGLALPAEMTLGRIDRRVGLRASLDQAARHAEAQSGIAVREEHYQSALQLLTTPQVRHAFDLAKEPDRLRDQYGRTKIGGRCLMARKLVEAGARFVMVDYGYDHDYGNVWDNHNAESQNHPHISKMVKRGYHVAGLDKAFSALLNDLKQRQLLESTLVVFLTEFGRTPTINPRGGRDHWGACGSIFFSGAGTQVGQVVGTSDKHGAYPVTRGYSPADVAATIYHLLGLKLQQQIKDHQGRLHPLLDDGEPIAEILSS